MRFISIDIGNSRIKLQVDGQAAPQVARTGHTLEFSLPDEPLDWFVSSVNAKLEERLAAWVRQQRPEDRWTVLQQASIPLTVAVDHPRQVGKDRLLAALAAKERMRQVGTDKVPAGPIIVVDSGTAVTIDLVTADGIFQGGVIYPGIESSFQQLAERTAALPNLDYDARQARLSTAVDSAGSVWGRNTEDAILLGIYQSQWSAILAIVQRFQANHPAASVVLTGGGLEELRAAHQHGWLNDETGKLTLWPGEWIQEPDLVLMGVSIAARSLTSGD